MKKIILAIAALFIAFLAACTSDYGSGTAANAGEGPIVIPSTHKAADFEEPEEESSASEDGIESSSSSDDEEENSSDSKSESSSSSKKDASSSSSKK